MKSSPFVPTQTVAEIVVAQPMLARIFEQAGIDYCCGGKRTLASACATAGLDSAALITRLESAVAAEVTPEGFDPASASLTALADHIEQTHHRALRAELPPLLEKAVRVAGKHGWRDARLHEVAATVRTLAEEMFHHLAKEELVLFPAVRQLESEGTVSPCGGSLLHPIQQMEHEHDQAGGLVARLRELTDDFTPDEQACNTHRALLAGLAWLENDLHQHVHKENNILFPRALARETPAVA